MVVGTESYSRARMPESGDTDKDETESKIGANDVESSPLQSSEVIEHKA